MNYYNDIQSLIGKTPLLKLNHLNVRSEVNIYAKLEGFNPGGSCKDRIGIYMIDQAEKQGLIKPGYTIIEATAGNTGIGIAIAAINKGYNIIFVVPTKFSIEKQKLMKALGGEIINTPKEKGMQGAVDVAEDLLRSIPNSISLKQFDNLSNPLSHYETTGKEIYDDLDGQIDYFVAGAGSGGTFSGVVQYLKERIPNLISVLADPEGSTMGGGQECCYKVEGIGNNFIPNTMNMDLVDKIIKTTDNEAFNLVTTLAKNEGIIVGSSSGAALSATLKFASTIDKGNIVVVFPDRGERYFSTGLF